MNFNVFWITLILILIIGGKATMSRSPHMEMKKVKETKIFTSKVDLNEFWPFPKTLSEGDPYVIELERN